MKSTGSLNHVYRLVWSQALGIWVAVAEISSGRGKTKSRSLVAAALTLTAGLSLAGPSGGVVASGSGSISQNGATTTINQASQNLNLNWQSFNVAVNEKVNFVQPSASAVAVNRIYDTAGSQIMGQINANGQVYLINPNGILFGKDAQVNVGGLVASTLDLQGDASGSTRRFSGNGTGTITNLGKITATGDGSGKGGYVALLGNTVSNQGSIQAHLGTVALGAGKAIVLTMNAAEGTGLVHMQIDESTLNTLAANGGLIQADGGKVWLSAGAKDSLLASVVNNTGVIEARTVQNQAGTIVLMGGMAAGTTHVAGTLDASTANGANSGNGGFIETSAGKVKIADAAKITTAAANGKTGTWLIDPVDFTIAATGGDITGAALSANLANSDIKVESSKGTQGTAGDVNVNDSVSWSNNKLTLSAQNNININQSLNASANAKLAFEYGLGAKAKDNTSSYKVNAAINLPKGDNFSTTLGSDGVAKTFTVITELGAQGSTTPQDLQGMNGGLTKNYALGANIDATATKDWNSGVGFAPVGSQSSPFGGTFDGLGHTITGLTINRSKSDRVGLFGVADGATIQNVGLVGGTIKGFSVVGGLAGRTINTAIHNSYATAAVSAVGTGTAGGLVGYAETTNISNSYATGAVYSGSNGAGGLVGVAKTTNISNSYASGVVSSPKSHVGGLVGYAMNNSTISNSFASGAVSGKTGVGGLVGTSSGTAVNNSYATGDVAATDGYLGGLMGDTSGDKFINVYAAGKVVGLPSPTGKVGSLFGNASRVSIDGGIASQTNNADLPVIGLESGSISVKNISALTSADFRTPSKLKLFGFNFTSTPGATGNNWVMVNANGSLVSNAQNGAADTTPMLASEYSKNISNAHQLQLMAMDLGASYTLANNIDASATGSGKDVWGSKGFVPVGKRYAEFTGKFDGLGQTVTGLTINRTNADDVGLFGRAAGATIQNVGLVGGSIAGTSYVGGLAGFINTTAINNSYVTGAVSGNFGVGGLVGESDTSTISNSYATGAVTGTPGSWNADLSVYIGGLVGILESTSTVSNSYATGEVSGTSVVGGLLGAFANSSVINSYWNKTKSTAGVGDADRTGQKGAPVGLSTGDFMKASSFASWGDNISSTGGSTAVWRIYEGYSGPLLRSFLKAIDLGASVKKTYNGLTQTVNSAAGRNAGTYASYSDQQGYDITNGGLIITAKALTVTGINVATNRTYDGTDAALITGTAALAATQAAGAGTGNDGKAYASDIVTLSGMVSGKYNSKDVATANKVTLTGLELTGADKGNYTLMGASEVAATITAKELSVSGLRVAESKVYDGTTAATVTGTATLGAGVITGDTVNLTGTATGTYNSKDVGSAGSVKFAGLSVDNTNYRLKQQATADATITAKELTMSGLRVAESKVYDGTKVAAVTGTAALADAQAVGTGSSTDGKAYVGDSVAISGTATGTYNSKDVASASTVTLTGLELTGEDKGNYKLKVASELAAKITAKAIALTGTLVETSKTYDGTTTANLLSTAKFESQAAGAGTSTDGKAYTGDVVTVKGAGKYNSKDVATARTVNFDGLALDGAAKGNYTLKAVADANATITAKELGVSGLSVDASKVYDGTKAAVVKGSATLVGMVKGEEVTLGGKATATYNSKDVKGAASVAFAGLTIEDSNYSLKQQVNQDATITAKELSVSGLSVDASKVYDGSKAAVVIGSAALSGVVKGEEVSVGGKATATYNSKDVKDAKSVAFAGLTIEDSNYSLKQQANQDATITAKELTMSGLSVEASKVYDGTKDAVVKGGATLAGVVKGEEVTLGGKATATYNSKDVKDAKTVVFAGLTIEDTNYSLKQHAGQDATITAKELTMSGLSVDASKVYDGSKAAVVKGSATLAGMVKGEEVTLGGKATASYNSKDVKDAKSVVFAGLTIEDNNYSLKQHADQGATISAKELSVSGLSVDASRVYDGTKAAAVKGTAALSGVVTGENVTTAGKATATYNSKDVKDAKSVAFAGLELGGSDKANYTLAAHKDQAASITAKELSVSGLSVDASRVYDGTKAAAVKGTAALSGVVTGENVITTGKATATYNSKDVKTANSVAFAGLTLDGSDKANYVLAAHKDQAASITAKELSVSGLSVAQSRVYDGTKVAAVTGTAKLGAGVVEGDSVAITGTATGTYNSKDVATASSVKFAGLGVDNSNYSVQQPADQAATITAKELSMSGLSVAASRTYDGTTSATVLGSASLAERLAAGAGSSTDGKAYSGDSINFIGKATATYNSKDVQNAESVRFAGLSIDNSNYRLKMQADAKAKISKATLVYQAQAAEVLTGQTATGLTGEITGFVAGETLAKLLTAKEASGTAVWTTEATTASTPGNYAIKGAGISANNYELVQAASNSTRLTVKPGSAPAEVVNAVGGLALAGPGAPVSTGGGQPFDPNALPATAAGEGGLSFTNDEEAAKQLDSSGKVVPVEGFGVKLPRNFIFASN